MATGSELKALANVVAEKENADVFLLSAGIETPLDRSVRQAVAARRRRRPKAFLILTTEGGDADVAYKISRSFQDSYDTFAAVVAGWCKSAGTLICVGANEIILGPFSELGPLDVQLSKPDDLGGRLSGLTIDSAFRSLQAAAFNIFEEILLDVIRNSGGRITTRTAAGIASEITVGLLAPIFSQMDPNKIGDDYRSTQIAEQYAIRLDLKARNLRSFADFDAVEALVRGFPSHSFVIDAAEAKQLFHRVTEPQGALEELITAMGDLCITPRSAMRNEKALMTFLNDEVQDDQANAKGEKAAPKPERRRDADKKG